MDNLETYVRYKVKDQINSTVSLSLVAFLLIGSFLLTTFVSLQIIGESKAAVLEVNAFLRDVTNKPDWTGMRNWIADHQSTVTNLVQTRLPNAINMATIYVEDAFEARDMSHVLEDAKYYYAYAAGTSYNCSDKLVKKLAYDYAKAEFNVNDIRLNLTILEFEVNLML